MPQDPSTPPRLKVADDALQSAVRLAVLEEDTPRAMDMMRGYQFDETFRNDILGGVMGLADDVDFVRFLIEEMETEVTATRCIFLLNAACRKNLQQTAVYLVEKALAENVSAEDCYQRIFANFPPKEAAEIAVTLAEKTPDRDAALTDMMLQAAMAKSYETLGTLVDAGAKAGAHTPVILLGLSMCENKALYEDKDSYLTLFEKVLQTATAENLAVIDLMVPVVAYKIPDGQQYPEMLDMLLAAGADPFAMKCEAQRSLVRAFNAQNRTEKADHWEAYFQQAQDSYTRQYREIFDEKFGDGFKIEDLLKSATDEGDTGLTLAARARRLDVVLAAAVQQKTAALTLDTIFNQAARRRSALTLAIDRHDLAALIQPAYWLQHDARIIQSLESRLTDEQKKGVDLDALSAKVDQYRLKQQAGRFKLGPKRG